MELNYNINVLKFFFMIDYFNLNLNMEIFPVQDGLQVVEFKGNMDKVGLQSIKEKLEKLVETFESIYLVFDFDQLEFINSEAIGFLLTLHSRLIKKDKKIMILKPKSHVLDVLNVIGLSKIIECYDTMELLKGSIKG